MRGFLALLILAVAGGSCALGQTAQRLSQVKKVYVGDFGSENGADWLREKLIERVRLKRELTVVSSVAGADAVIRGEGAIWPVGYASTDPRSPAELRQPIYRGYLSLEVLGQGNEPLWSYLVTPSKFRRVDIASDLADQLVARLLSAEKQGEFVAPPLSAVTGENVALAAAGATFPAPLYQKWFQSFGQRYPNVRINYRAIGSGAGLELLLRGQLDFAASDMPLSDTRMAEAKKTFLHFASVIGAVVPAYHVEGLVEALNFTPQVLTGIYLGKIRKWNDPAIQETNPREVLPDADIVVLHRSDSSGTTYVWTDYLCKGSSEWKESVGEGTVVRWPVGTGAEGNEGVAHAVQQAPNSIGYVELVYALRHQLSYGAVRNAAGRFVQADLPSVTAAGADAAAATHSGFRVSITNSSGRGAYPIASLTWWLLPQAAASDAKRAAVADLLGWMLTSGQKDCSALGYVPLPREIAEGELELVRTLK